MFVTAYSGESLGYFFFVGNSSVVPDTCSDVVLGVYDVRHL